MAEPGAKQERLWLTTEQVAAQLGVKPATLYAYVSRGLVTSRRADSGRGSLFHRDDIARLATTSRGRRDRTPEVVVHSGVTYLADGQLRYRGHDAVELSGSRSFEEVAELLWTGTMRDTRPWRAHQRAVEVARGVVRQLPATTPKLELLRVACTVAASIDPLGAAQDPDSLRATGRALISTLVEALPVAQDRQATPAASIAGRLWSRLTPRRPLSAHVGLLDAALVLLADHELAASTMSARIAASARCDPYAVVECGLATVSGSWHGRSTLTVERLLIDLQEAGVEKVIPERLREHAGLPGFGHRIHRTQDPRAGALLQLLRGVVGDKPLADVDMLIESAEGRNIGPPNVDLALAALTTSLRMPVGSAEAIFGLARCAGWLAHAFEQYERGELIRPRALYIGPAG